MADASIQGALPGYEVGGELGRGAMGEVLAGHHTKLDRDVAIKRLPKAFSHDEEVVARFGTEARVLASLSHPHIVPVYDYVEQEGLCLLVMQALTGGTVWDRFRTEGLSMQAACAVLVATCAGLHHAHGKRVLHRDIKPDNLMFDADETLMVTDFGIAAVLGGDATLATLDGQIIGTPAYMAPEQAEGSAVGPAADVYAAGTMFYELLSGRLPFPENGDPVDLLQRRLHEDPEPLDRVAPDVPGPLVAVVMKAIARRPENRYAGAEAFGVAVAEASVAAWGPGWLDQAELRLLTGTSLAVASSAGTTIRPGDESAVDGPDRPGTVIVEARDRTAAAPETVARGADPPAPSSRPTEVPARVHPDHEQPASTVDLRGVDPREVVPVADLLRPPPVPVTAVVAAAVMALALVASVLLGVGSSAPDEGTIEATAVAVDGRSLADGAGEVDLGDPVVVRVSPVPPGATSARLTFTQAGLEGTGSDVAPLVDGDDGSASATLWGRTARIATSGDMTAEVSFVTDDGTVVATRRFTVDSAQPAYGSLSGLVSLALGAIALAYAASVSKPLRLGRRKVSAMAGMALIGAALGIALALGAWTLLGPQPTIASIVVDGVLGAAAFGVGGWALFRLGRRRRLMRAMART